MPSLENWGGGLKSLLCQLSPHVHVNFLTPSPSSGNTCDVEYCLLTPLTPNTTYTATLFSRLGATDWPGGEVVGGEEGGEDGAVLGLVVGGSVGGLVVGGRVVCSVEGELVGEVGVLVELVVEWVLLLEEEVVGRVVG